VIQDPSKEAKYMLYIGIDVHKKNLVICILDANGNRISSCRLENTPESVIGYFATLALPARVALEATHNWGLIYDLLKGMGFDVRVCHSKQAKMIGLATVKTDKIDAFKLGTLLRCGLLPECYVPNPGSRELRSIVRGRAALKGTSTALKNQIHAILRANWIQHTYSDLFGKSGRAFLERLQIEDGYKAVINSKLAVLDSVERQIAKLDEEIKRRAHVDLRAMLLATAPGFAEFRSVMLLAEVDTILRFGRAESFVCYTGLNPSESSSGEKVRRGRITKEGSTWLRWIFVEAAHQAIKEEGKIRDLYLRVSAKKGHNKGVVAAARELAVSVYWMLSRMDPYRANGRRPMLIVSSEAR
jgi:transposase